MWPPIPTNRTPTRTYWNNRRRHLVYRFYNRHGELLYVGMSSSIYDRLYEHRRTSPWFPEVERARFTVHPSRGAASLAERKAILAEAPLHNRRRDFRAVA